MPQQLKIKTDKGIIRVGLTKPDNTNPGFTSGKLLTSFTNLVAFSGLTDTPRHIWPNATGRRHLPQDSTSNVCTLTNGNKLVITSYYLKANDDCSIAVELYFTGDPDKSVIMDTKYYSKSKNAHTPVGLTELFPHLTNGNSWGLGYFDFGDPQVVGGYARYTYTKQQKILADFVNGSIVVPFPGEDNEDDPSGGDGEGPDGVEDDPIEAPEDPGISAVDSGLLTLYVPSLNNIHEFGNFLWSDLFSLDTFKKLFADPMEAVIGISVLPISVPHTAGAESITIGQIESGVFAPLASKQFVKKDCGTLKVNPIWNTALDYDPYTKFSIYLPYIGTRDLKTDDIMGKDLNVSYLIDILSGSCTAHIKVGGSVLYQFSGSCAVPIPLSGTSWTNLLTSSIQLAGTGIAAAMTAGASTVVSAAATGMAVAGTAGLVSASKQAIQRTGAVSGAAGMLGVQTPYLIRETPRQSLAKGYNKFVGYPSNITSKLGDLKGFTQVENIHLENLSCTADEAAEIESLLKEGVII